MSGPQYFFPGPNQVAYIPPTCIVPRITPDIRWKVSNTPGGTLNCVVTLVYSGTFAPMEMTAMTLHFHGIDVTGATIGDSQMLVDETLYQITPGITVYNHGRIVIDVNLLTFDDACNRLEFTFPISNVTKTGRMMRVVYVKSTA